MKSMNISDIKMHAEQWIADILESNEKDEGEQL